LTNRSFRNQEWGTRVKSGMAAKSSFMVDGMGSRFSPTLSLLISRRVSTSLSLTFQASSEEKLQCVNSTLLASSTTRCLSLVVVMVSSGSMTCSCLTSNSSSGVGQLKHLELHQTGVFNTQLLLLIRRSTSSEESQINYVS